VALSRVMQTIEDAAELGYDTLSVSGGEPFLYPGLAAALGRARSAGMRTLVTSNGTLCTPARLARVAPELDLLAISLDGPATEHDLMRGRSGAFERLLTGLPALRASGIPFGFLITLTQFNAHQLEWAANFARDPGAVMLQVHPPHPPGRGQRLPDELPDGTEQTFAAFEVARLRARHAGGPRVEYDVASQAALAAMRRSSVGLSRLVDWVSPLVLEPDGTLVPMEYGFSRDWALGNVRTDRLARLAADGTALRLDEFQRLCLDVLDRLQDRQAAPLAYWYAEIRAAAKATVVG
jgi:MoaA/NifB/PqqE/SkfB family radical SAM enzyme